MARQCVVAHCCGKLYSSRSQLQPNPDQSVGSILLPTTMARLTVLIVALALIAAVAVQGASAQKPAAKNAAKSAAPQYPTILAAAQAGKLNILIAAVKAANLTGPVTDPKTALTVFAPTDAAFAALLKKLNTTSEKLLANKALLTQVLQYHLVPQVVPSSAIKSGASVETALKGKKLSFKVTGGKVAVIGGDVTANVVKADLTAGKSVVHVIDAVLVPSA